MTDAGSALMGIGEAGGENRPPGGPRRRVVAAPRGLGRRSTGVLLNITGGPASGSSR